MSWIQTYSGLAFDPFMPSFADIRIEDIAHQLALTNRYGGATKVPYSVAQHSVLVAGFVPPESRLAALLHDAAEAYLGDVPAPIRRRASLREFNDAENKLRELILLRFEAVHSPMVDSVDCSITRNESLNPRLFPNGPTRDWSRWIQPLDGLEPDFPIWTWQEAEANFLATYQVLTSFR